MKSLVSELVRLVAELPAGYVTICKYESGRATVSLRHDTDEDLERAAQVFGLSLETNFYGREFWRSAEFHLNERVKVAIYGPHREVIGLVERTTVCSTCGGSGCDRCDGSGVVELDVCADCGNSTAVGTPDPHECGTTTSREVAS